VNGLLSPLRHVARVTIEAMTPISFASGEMDVDLDTPLFRDWNDLPCLSGAALAGVLRSLFADHFNQQETEALFGFEELGRKDGRASRLFISFGIVHNSQDRAVERPLSADEISGDVVLELLARPAPVRRDHVAIEANSGAAADKAKFERAACPKGIRFSFELALDGVDAERAEDEERLRRVVSLLTARYARLGGAGRRGYGRFRMVRAHYLAIDRRGIDGRSRWIAYRRSSIDGLPGASGSWARWDALTIDHVPSARRPITGCLTLVPKGFWRFGSGKARWLEGGEKAPQRLPLTEPVIDWPDDGDPARAKVVETFMTPVPGSAVKGALAHRAEFHLRRIRGCAETRDDCRRLIADVLGSVGDTRDGKARGAAGAVYIDDAYVDFGTPDYKAEPGKRAGLRTRNSIDRHVGGVRMGKLFTDETPWRGPAMVMDIVVLARPRGAGGVSLCPDVGRALDWALADLCEGRLAVGAGDGVGDGVMEAGSVMTWDGGVTGLGAALSALGKAADGGDR
jgi:CRISPR/Cas system CMR subunit Cmr4 (Cas7 group RAMP superfamily)